MSILHITTGANYEATRLFIKFVNENFDVTDHTFLVIDDKENVPNELKANSNIIVIDKNKTNYFRTLLLYMKENGRIILHSLCLGTYFQLFLLFKPSLLNKMIWVAWGMDLYQWKRDNKRSIVYEVRNLIAYTFRKRIRNFVGIFPPDIDFFKKEFKSKAKTYYASYVGGLYNSIYKKEIDLISLSQKILSNSCINIQIGHQCNYALNHFLVLEQLSKFENENIRIYLPLSYGDMAYGDQVEQYAKKIFEDKVCCVREKMTKEDYINFLSMIDIGVFNITRQIGLGNIVPLICMGKKLFMPAGSVMYDYYKSYGIEISDYKQIANMGFSDFVKPVDMSSAKHYIESQVTNKDLIIKMWTRVFNAQMK